MRKNLFFFISALLLLPALSFGAVIEGKLVSLDPLTKSIRVKRVNEQGKEEQMNIGVPDGVPYSGSAPSFAELPAGTKIAITVEMGERPGTWEAVKIQQLAEPGKRAEPKKTSTIDPERMKAIMKEIEARKKETGSKLLSNQVSQKKPIASQETKSKVSTKSISKEEIK